MADVQVMDGEPGWTVCKNPQYIGLASESCVSLVPEYMESARISIVDK